MMRTIRYMMFLFAVALVATANVDLAAQTAVEWEALPASRAVDVGGARTDGLAISQQPDGSYVVYAEAADIDRFDEVNQRWVTLCRGAACSASALLARDSVIIGGGPSRASRSTDHGETWTHDAPTSMVALLWGDNPGTRGAVLGNRVFSLYRSDDRGLTYTELGAFGGWTHDIAEVPASGALPAGRILAAMDGGVTYSDDDGLSFQPSGIHGRAGLIMLSVTFAPEPGHPYGGAAYASGGLQTGVQRRVGVVFRSDDGGATWAEVLRTEVRDYGLVNPDKIRVLGAPDGSLWVGLVDAIGGTAPSLGSVLVSRDGGESFEWLREGWGGYSPNAMRIAPDGRVYVATDSLVWRTREAAIVSRAPAPSASGARLRVSPNPSSGAVQIALDLDTPEAARLRVYDARGREVYAKASGARTEHAWEVDTSAWAAGVYVARAKAGGEVVSARFTVTR